MIKTLSPYYVTTPFTLLGSEVCNKYTLEILIWQGGKIADVPADPTYSITINNPTASTGNSKVNISRLINSYLEFVPVTLGSTSMVNSDNQMWVRTQVEYYIDDVLQPEIYHRDTQLAVKGYGYGLSGENPDTPDNKILIRNGEYTMTESGVFIVPIELDETVPPTPEIVITGIVQDGTTFNADVTFTNAGTYTEFRIEKVLGAVTLANTVTTTSPQTVSLPAYSSWDVTMYGYDEASNTNVVSNTFPITMVA